MLSINLIKFVHNFTHKELCSSRTLLTNLNKVFDIWFFNLFGKKLIKLTYRNLALQCAKISNLIVRKVTKIRVKLILQINLLLKS